MKYQVCFFGKDLKASLLIISLCFALSLIFVSTAYSQGRETLSPQTIIRIVNDYPISQYDIDARMRMVTATAGRPPSNESLQRIRAQVLETLIDERIQLQEAERLGITVENEEIQAAIATIEKTNGMPEGALVETLSSRGIDVGTLIAQIRATLAWRKVIAQRVRGRVQISDEDVDAYLADLGQKGGAEYLLAEIFVAAPTLQDLPRAKAVAEDLAQQIRRGVQFPALARQFSQAPTAAAGGDLGWVEAAQLDPRLVTVLENLPVGQVSNPIEVDDGYYLLALRDRRLFGSEGQEQMFYEIQRYFAPFEPSATNAAKLAILRRAEQAHKTIASCADVQPAAQRFGAEATDMGQIPLANIPGPLRPLVEDLEPGEKTEVLTLSDGVLIMVLCDKGVRTIGLPEAEEVRAMLLNRRLDLEARRYLRDLRQNALIEDGR
jgi:peptidyl-prolyl cis-trans isomerase SurA